MNKYSLVSSILTEKAKSKAQQRLFGMVSAVQKHEIKAPSKGIAKIAKDISPSEADKFAKTRQQGLPEKVNK